MAVNHPSKAALHKSISEVYLEQGFLFYGETLKATTKSIDFFHNGNFRLDSPTAQETIKLRIRIENRKEELNRSIIYFLISLAYIFLIYHSFGHYTNSVCYSTNVLGFGRVCHFFFYIYSVIREFVLFLVYYSYCHILLLLLFLYIEH